MSRERFHAPRPVSWKPVWTLSLILLAQVTGCTVQTATEDDDTTNTFVRVNSLVAAEADQGDELFSDVCLSDPDDPEVCTVTNDNAQVFMSAQAKDLTRLQSNVQDVVFNRYRVTYIRADGRNTPGVDVPHPFDGAATFRVPIDGTEASRVFMIVRPQAKLESPLREMVGGGGSQVLSVLAQVDFFGTDIAGRTIQVTASISITFADFADDN